jgi:hypothetical protein
MPTPIYGITDDDAPGKPQNFCLHLRMAAQAIDQAIFLRSMDGLRSRPPVSSRAS